MNNFNYFAPTKVVFGKNTESQTGSWLKRNSVKKS